MSGKSVAGHSSILMGEGYPVMFAPLKFLWNATRGNRLTPWRSEYLKWRIETYSGKKADTLSARDIFGFVWESRGELLDFLVWTGRLERDVHRKS